LFLKAGKGMSLKAGIGISLNGLGLNYRNIGFRKA